MKMLASYILIKPQTMPEQKMGAILLPDNQKARATFARGEVIGVGPGAYLPSGDQLTPDMVPGDRVLYFKASAAHFVVRGEEMHLVQEREILAILEDGDFDNKETTDADD